MPVKTPFKLLLIISILAGLVKCMTLNQSQDEYSFEWNLSYENHSGTPKDLYLKDGKHRGMSVFNWRNYKEEYANQLIKNNIEWVALIPFLYQKTEKTKLINPLQKAIGEWSNIDSMYMDIVSKIHKRGMHIMFKPHLWMSEGWRSNIYFDNEKEWDDWFESYRQHMIHYAYFCETLDIELFCIGVEFRSSIKAQPEKWESLIKEIKSIYKGKLTYAANWDDEFNDITFWDQMDYIGIQAYYPLTQNKSPKLSEIKNGWKKHIKKLSTLSEKHNKPILFTETGYRSDEKATIEPWVWGSSDTLQNKSSFITQDLAYEALFQQLWDKDWFAGVYFWQWHNRSKEGNFHESMDFTPRFKPAENTMAKWYGRETNQ